MVDNTLRFAEQEARSRGIDLDAIVVPLDVFVASDVSDSSEASKASLTSQKLYGKSRPVEELTPQELAELPFSQFSAYLRRRAGLHQKEVLERMAMGSGATMSRIESGRAVPDEVLFPKLQAALGVEPESSEGILFESKWRKAKAAADLAVEHRNAGHSARMKAMNAKRS